LEVAPWRVALLAWEFPNHLELGCLDHPFSVVEMPLDSQYWKLLLRAGSVSLSRYSGHRLD
jgi:hypothetical protein